MTRDTDIALPARVPLKENSLRERLVAAGFHEKFFGDDRPPVTHDQLGDHDAGFYVEFLTPLAGGEFRRNATRDVTMTIAGVNAQKLRYLDVLLVSPWVVTANPGPSVRTGGLPATINIANPVSYIVQKLLVNKRRKPQERAKDALYIHDTIEVFGRSLPELRQTWTDHVRPSLNRGLESKLKRARAGIFGQVTDLAREAVRMATGRRLSPAGLVETCEAGLAGILD